jgi:hypothetical protein
MKRLSLAATATGEFADGDLHAGMTTSRLRTHRSALDPTEALAGPDPL